MVGFGRGSGVRVGATWGACGFASVLEGGVMVRVFLAELSGFVAEFDVEILAFVVVVLEFVLEVVGYLFVSPELPGGVL